MEDVESKMSFHYFPHQKRVKILIISGVEMWKLKPCFNYIERKKMYYSKTEIETIFSNCLTYNELLKACERIKLLIEAKEQQNSMHLHLAAHLQYRKIIDNESH